MAKKTKQDTPQLQPDAAPPARHPGGRPTDYRPEYCDLLIEHMGKGLSFESFAGYVRCAKQTLYNWANDNQEFAEAKAIGTEVCRLFWERMGVAGAAGKVDKFNSRAWLFNMKNRFADEWRDKREIDGNLVHVSPQMQLAQMIMSMPPDVRHQRMLEAMQGEQQFLDAILVADGDKPLGDNDDSD